jgi:hypothetical protein
MSNQLNEAAYKICLRIRDEGAFAEELELVANQQPAACPEAIAALRRQCPGLPTADYQKAIARGMYASR